MVGTEAAPSTLSMEQHSIHASNILQSLNFSGGSMISADPLFCARTIRHLPGPRPASPCKRKRAPSWSGKVCTEGVTLNHPSEELSRTSFRIRHIVAVQPPWTQLSALVSASRTWTGKFVYGCCFPTQAIFWSRKNWWMQLVLQQPNVIVFGRLVAQFWIRHIRSIPGDLTFYALWVLSPPETGP